MVDVCPTREGGSESARCFDRLLAVVDVVWEVVSVRVW